MSGPETRSSWLDTSPTAPLGEFRRRETCRKLDYVMCISFGDSIWKKYMISTGFRDFYCTLENSFMKINNSVFNDQAVLHEPTVMLSHGFLNKIPAGVVFHNSWKKEMP